MIEFTARQIVDNALAQGADSDAVFNALRSYSEDHGGDVDADAMSDALSELTGPGDQFTSAIARRVLAVLNA
jgi:hypothetical protein